MLFRIKYYAIVIFAVSLTFADNIAAQSTKIYTPAKVVYDFSSPEPETLKNVLDRISYLQNIYDNNSFEASIVVVIHESAIPLFTKSYKNRTQSKISVTDLMKRANSLTMGEIISFKVCKASADMQGIKKEELAEFTSLIPMADVEIIMLQQNGYSYLH